MTKTIKQVPSVTMEDRSSGKGRVGWREGHGNERDGDGRGRNRKRERVRGREGGENESIVYNKIFTLYHNTIPQFLRCKDTRHHHFNTA